MRFASIVCPALLLLTTASVNAHGPGEFGHAGGGRPNFAGGTTTGPGAKPGKFEGGPGFGDKLKAIHNTDGDGKADNSDFAGLHPNAVHALKAAVGSNTTPLTGKFTGQG